MRQSDWQGPEPALEAVRQSLIAAEGTEHDGLKLTDTTVLTTYTHPVSGSSLINEPRILEFFRDYALHGQALSHELGERAILGLAIEARDRAWRELLDDEATS